jgi:penicillin V acylase-like amidase (Ntn superfamily)
MHSQLKMIVGVILFVVLYQNVFPCTGFVIKDGNRTAVCFNFDFWFGAGHIYVNKRNMDRQRFLLYAEKPVQWTSKFGNITFSLIGRD